MGSWTNTNLVRTRSSRWVDAADNNDNLITGEAKVMENGPEFKWMGSRITVRREEEQVPAPCLFLQRPQDA